MFKLVAAFLILPTAGLCAFFPSRRLELHPAARFAVLTLLGTSLFCMEFFLLSVSGLPWSTAWVALPAVVGIAVGIWRGSLAWPSRTTFSIAELVGLALACVSIAFLAYALLTARATSIDYVYFWGTK